MKKKSTCFESQNDFFPKSQMGCLYFTLIKMYCRMEYNISMSYDYTICIDHDKKYKEYKVHVIKCHGKGSQGIQTII